MIYSKLQTLSSKNNGFTLIELMIAITMFSVIVGAIISLLVSAIQLQRYNLAYQQLLDQTSYAIEYMGRLIRMAKKDTDGSCITSGRNYKIQPPPGIPGVSALMFEDYQGRCKGFFATQDGQLEDYEKDRVPGFPSFNVFPLTSGNFEVVSFNPVIFGDVAGDKYQPRVTISMEIKRKGSGFQPKIMIQTTISQRNLDK